MCNSLNDKMFVVYNSLRLLNFIVHHCNISKSSKDPSSWMITKVVFILSQ